MRIPYVDSIGRAGELEMANVRVGDIVRFIADFNKTGAGVRKDELGEVVALAPESLVVRTSGRSAADGTAEVELTVTPRDVAVLVHDSDPRTAAVRADLVERCLGQLVAAGLDVRRADIVRCELLRRGHRRIAAEVRGGLGWAVWMLGRFGRIAKGGGAGLSEEERAQAVTLSEGLEPSLVDWALVAMRKDFEATQGRPPELTSRKDALWCLDALATDLEQGPVRPELTLEDENPEFNSVPPLEPDPDADAADVADLASMAARVHEQFRRLDALSDADWQVVARWRQEMREGPIAPAPAAEPAPASAPVEEPPAAPAAVSTAPENRLPLGMPPGHGYAKFWSDPGMRVFSRDTKEKGTVVGTLPGDQLVVQTDGDQQEIWDPTRTVISLDWTGPKEYVKEDEYSAWKSQRRKRLRGFVLSSEGEIVGRLFSRHAECYVLEA